MKFRKMIFVTLIFAFAITGCSQAQPPRSVAPAAAYTTQIVPEALLIIPDSIYLLHAITWTDNSKEVERFKKLHLTAYPDKTIGEAMTGDYAVQEWKYGTSGGDRYLMCNYKYNKKSCTLIIYKDAYDNVNAAEYYEKDGVTALAREIEGLEDVKGKSYIKKITDKMFVKEKEKTKDSSESKSNNTAQDKSSGNNAASIPGPRSDGKISETKYYVTDFDDNDYQYQMTVEKFSDGKGFNFEIFKCKEFGKDRKLLFNKHYATYIDAGTAIYYGKNYTVGFNLNVADRIYVLGLESLLPPVGQIFLDSDTVS